jgi:hypothetical protein
MRGTIASADAVIYDALYEDEVCYAVVMVLAQQMRCGDVCSCTGAEVHNAACRRLDERSGNGVVLVVFVMVTSEARLNIVICPIGVVTG